MDLLDPVPDHSTISQLRRRKPSFRKIFRRLFEEVVYQCIAKGLVTGHLAATDSTHVKANASRASEALVEMPEEPGIYWERLDRYEEAAQEELEKKTGIQRKRRTKQVKKVKRRSHKRVSKTDPEAGYMDRPGKPKGMHYLSHQTVDTEYGIVLDVAVTPGNSSDVAPYLDQLQRINETVIPILAATADAAYDVPLVHQELARENIHFFVHPHKRGKASRPTIPSSDFLYNEEKDLYTCPNGKHLHLRRVGRSHCGVSWIYAASRQDCQCCPLKEQCLSASVQARGRILERNYFSEAVDRDFSAWGTPQYKDALKKRQIWCEGTFAAQKRDHNLTRVLRRGLEAAEDHCLLSATALNLKRMIKHMV